MHMKTLAELSAALKSKEISSQELTQHYLNRIATYDKELNSFITVNSENAIAAAIAADTLIAKGEGTVLTGIPIAQKDIFCTYGIRSSAGSKMLDNFIAPYNATIVEKCNAAGMVMLGKTNMDDMAMGSSNENSFYGPVKNPWDITSVSGGSSGGSAAAVAAGLAPIATGTDTGGSIRQPAAFCGITGLKPTYGLISRYGMIAFASSLDQGGPMGRTVEDVALLLNSIAGFDEKDSTSVQRQIPDYTHTLNNTVEGLRIGLPKEYFAEGLNSIIAKTIEDAAKEYEKLGATLHEISLPNTKASLAAYYVIAPAEASSNLSRYDGIRFGHRCENPKDLQELYSRSRAEGFGREVKRRIMMGTYMLSSGYYDAFYVKAQKIRRLIANDYRNAFQQVDLILGPTAPSVAFKLGEKSNDPVSMYLSDIYTIPVNLAGLPAISIPVGFMNNLPIGMHLIGNYFEEAKLLNAAHLYQMNTDWHQRIPVAYQ
ncbi:MAG: Glutamyl-tRNA(Gln) amidotransferase subunit A [Legionellaceae bacterium]